MRNSGGFRFLVLLWFVSPAMSLLSPMGVNFEVQALVGIRESLEDPHGVLENWDKNSVDPCSWTMVTCSPENLVIGLGTPSQNLSGTLSPAIGNLTNLQTVLLQNNNISGRIPPEIGKLSRLRTLDLSDNLLAGPIPSSLGQLKNLEYLRLNNNSLSGEFPQALANISALSFLDLSYNNLSGPVPNFPARTFSVVGNPLICATGSEKECFGAVSATFNSTFQNSSSTIIFEKSKTRRFAVALGLSVGGAALLILGLSLFIWQRHRRNQQIFFDVNDEQKKEEESNIGNLRRFQLRELQAATENFSEKNIVGKGGFGIVYRGVLRDGGVVAVKRLRDGGAAGGEVQFQTEVEMISLAVHRNLLRLSGYCATSNERILVYPFMPNGSVASRLKEKPGLDWAARRKIAVGAARGLLYLHEQCDPKIIHRDVKSANILLDQSLDPIVGDFGLAKLLDHGDSHVSTAVRGTVGHIAPEYLSTGQSSDKTDVFGFGILLLELVSGLTSHKGAILDWVKKNREEKKVELLVDKEMRGWDGVEVEEMVQVALLCTQFAPSQRPRMADVLRMLEGDGLADRWEASQKNAADSSSQKSKATAQEFSSSERFSDLTDDSLMLVQAIELSGPR